VFREPTNRSHLVSCAAECCSVVYYVAVPCCSVVHYVAVTCRVVQCVAVRCSALQRVCRSVLQCVARCCRVLQCVAVCCRAAHMSRTPNRYFIDEMIVCVYEYRMTFYIHIHILLTHHCINKIKRFIS